jgi:hypothetical protein|tara:strand:- start:2914 stop:3246 length:333 start_codon:yes stop_codon:yes gene_type:complete
MKKLLLLFVLSLMLPSCFGGDSESSSSSNDLLAFNYSEEFVKQSLKSPSTAKFPGTYEKRDYITKVSDNKYIIDAWVDSQNGFGAMIRSKYHCVIIFEGGKVKCEDLRIE